MMNRFCVLAVLVATCGFATAQESTPSETVIQPIPKEACGLWCICIIQELVELPNGFSWYIAERHEELCWNPMDCSDPSIVFLALPSGIPPDNCDQNGCTYGNHLVNWKKKSGGQLANALKTKVPHDFKPKFSDKYSGKIETIHTSTVAFTAKEQKKIAKVFVVKLTPTVVDEDHPVRIAAFGCEVESAPDFKPSVTVTNPKNIEEMDFGVYQVNIGGIHYGIAITDGSESLSAVSLSQPTLATR